VVKKK